MLIDANILLYAVDSGSPQHGPVSAWFEDALNGPERVWLPWQSIGAFLRIATHPRVAAEPLSASAAQEHVDRWLAAGPVAVAIPGERAVRALGDLVRRHQLTGNLIPDAQIAAQAIERGVAVASLDSDFARFPEIRWLNPLQPR